MSNDRVTQFEYVTATRGTEDQQIIDIARDWVMDVVDNPEDAEIASDYTIRRYIDRNYEGGWDQFLEDCA